jgi:hypothetical protein
MISLEAGVIHIVTTLAASSSPWRRDYHMIGEHPNTIHSNDFPEPRPVRPQETPNKPPAWVRIIGISIIVVIVLGALAGLATGIAALVAYATPPATSTSDQTFSVLGIPTLHINADAADVSITTGSAGQVSAHIEAQARALSSAAARDAVSQMKVTATQSGDVISFTQQSHVFDGPFVYQRDLLITLVVPQQANISSTLSAGNFSATGVQGTVRCTLNAGDITLTDAQVSSGTLDTNAGNVRLDATDVSGTTVISSNAGNLDLNGTLQPHSALSMRTNAGNVTVALPVTTDAHLQAKTNAGGISVVGWPIAVSQNFSEADASGDLAPSPTSVITLATNAGNVRLSAR